MSIGPLSRNEIEPGVCSYGDGALFTHSTLPALDLDHYLVDIGLIHLDDPGANPAGEAPWNLFCPNGSCTTCRTQPCAGIPPGSSPQHARIKKALSYGVHEIHLPIPSMGPILVLPGISTLDDVREGVSAWTAGLGNVLVHVYRVHPTGGSGFPLSSSYLAIPVGAPPSPLHPL
jgi:hypothetical protein